MPSLVAVAQCCSPLDQAEGKLSPDGKKIPTRGTGAKKMKVEKVPSECAINRCLDSCCLDWNQPNNLFGVFMYLLRNCMGLLY